MSGIGGRIAISLIDDGSQIHSLLKSTMTLNQSWTGNAASPDWSGNNNPIIYADIRNGVTPLDAVSNVKWSYNGTEITFNSNNISTNAGISGVFQKITHNSMPALKIIGNLAKSDSVNESVVALSGSVVVDTAVLPVYATINIRLSSFAQNGGYDAYIDSVDGRFAIENDGDTLYLYNVLKQAGVSDVATVQASDYIAEFYINGVQAASSKVTTQTIGGSTYYQLTVGDSDILDYAIIECKCYKKTAGAKGAYIMSSFIEVNDISDPEMMYISSTVGGTGIPSSQTTETGEGNDNSIHAGQYVDYDIWVATSTDVTAVNTMFAHYYIQLLTAQKEVYMGEVANANLGTPIASGSFKGYRKMLSPSTIFPSITSGHGMCRITAEHVKTLGRKMSGSVIASDVELTESM